METTASGRVVVGLCSSLGAYQALRYAVTQARERGSILIVVRAFKARGPGDVAWRANLNATAIAEVRTIFAEALGGMPPDLTVQLLVREGECGPSLVAIADRESDTLIIGGTVGRRFAAPWGGSIARFCAQKAACPVIIVPPPALSRAGRLRWQARAAAREAEDLLKAPSARVAKRVPQP